VISFSKKKELNCDLFLILTVYCEKNSFRCLVALRWLRDCSVWMGWDGTRASHLGACHSGLFYQLLAVPFVLASGNGSLHLGGW
jgi:hypothetical protein